MGAVGGGGGGGGGGDDRWKREVEAEKRGGGKRWKWRREVEETTTMETATATKIVNNSNN